MKKRILSFLVCLTMVVTTFAVNPLMANAETENIIHADETIVHASINYDKVAPFLPPVEAEKATPFLMRTMALAADEPEDAETTTKGMEISKAAVANEDGSVTITLEAFATGSKLISETKKEVPTDIVLVLDQSGSMSNSIGRVSFEAYVDSRYYYNTRNRDYYENRHNGGNANLYHKIADNSYVPVYVEKQSNIEYTRITNGRNSNYWENKDNLYASVNGSYLKVSVTRTDWNGAYTYKLPDGTVIATSSGYNSSPNFDGIDNKILYLGSEDEENAVYTYTYKDSDGKTQVLRTSTGADTRFSTLYEKVISNGGDSKLNALKSAVTTFVNNVSTKANGADGKVDGGDDIAHRIAIVGFASTGSSYKNTELLSTANEINYSSASSDDYKNALVSVNGTDGILNTRLTTAINRLSASGDTYLEYGMDMANKIFAQNKIGSDDTSGRQRVVVVFTDGYPAPSGTNDFNYTMADNAIKNSHTTKNGNGATVYTVAVLSDADPTASITDGYEYGGKDSTEQTVASNRYMHYVSSNYPNAEDMTNGGALSSDADPFNGGDSYYLSASDSDSLNNIFKQISDKVESGGSSTKLSSETIIKDIISPQFTLPKGATDSDITIETYSCTGEVDGEYTWKKNLNVDGTNDKMGASASANAEKGTVDVTGFDFAANYVGTVTEGESVTYRGDKLVIKFNVTPKAGFLGGNNVYTNTSAGVYANETATEPVLTFEKPIVNVPIKDVSVATTDKNVYLLGALTGEQLKENATVKVGNVELNLNKENYGLQPWQYEYVNIAVVIKDKDGKEITSFDNLTEDNKYTITVKVEPKKKPDTNNGTAAIAKDGTSGVSSINVFKPVVTFDDAVVYYGDVAPELKGTTAWMHGNDVAKPDDMIGIAPTVAVNCVAQNIKEQTPIVDGKINVREDISVEATTAIGDVDITGYTTFVRNACIYDNCDNTSQTSKTGDVEGIEFKLHVKTCTIEISKDGINSIDHHAKDGDADEERQTTLYDICILGQTKPFMTVAICGNNVNDPLEVTGLPVGNYVVKEKADWSWRYNPNKEAYSAPVSAKADIAIVEVVNSRFTNATSEVGWKWLNGGAYNENSFGEYVVESNQ